MGYLEQSREFADHNALTGAGRRQRIITLDPHDDISFTEAIRVLR